MSQMQDDTAEGPTPTDPSPIDCISNVSLPNRPPNTTWDVHLKDGRISDVTPHSPSGVALRTVDGDGALLTPSLCHPHIHLDKPYLLSHPKYADLQIERGDFPEAMALTGAAKARFSHRDLLERGQRLVDESVEAGTTHMRAFVEVDAGVGTKCLDAGAELQRRAEGRCVVQLCAFAQLPLFSAAEGDGDGRVIRGLLEDAAARPEVRVVGSTPYVETDRARMERNVDWMVELSARFDVHLDFHLDYSVDRESEPMVWYVVRALREKRWSERTNRKTVVLGHCTRLIHFGVEEWCRLKGEIGDLPVSFVGLPTSDLFMMRTPELSRGTLDIPRLIKDYGLNCCLGINNIGNAFTPHGSCDPLTLAGNGVGIYQAGTKSDAELLFECVSTRARRAIGLCDSDQEGAGSQKDRIMTLDIAAGDRADLVLFGRGDRGRDCSRKSVSEAVYLYDSCRGRKTYLSGRIVSGDE